MLITPHVIFSGRLGNVVKDLKYFAQNPKKKPETPNDNEYLIILNILSQIE
jgi:hypothetical protein